MDSAYVNGHSSPQSLPGTSLGGDSTVSRLGTSIEQGPPPSFLREQPEPHLSHWCRASLCKQCAQEDCEHSCHPRIDEPPATNSAAPVSLGNTEISQPSQNGDDTNSQVSGGPIVATDTSPTTEPKRRQMSEDAKRRIGESQRRRRAEGRVQSVPDGDSLSPLWHEHERELLDCLVVEHRMSVNDICGGNYFPERSSHEIRAQLVLRGLVNSRDQAISSAQRMAGETYMAYRFWLREEGPAFSPEEIARIWLRPVARVLQDLQQLKSSAKQQVVTS